MRCVNKHNPLLIFSVLLLAVGVLWFVVPQSASALNGLTVSPATTTLSLGKDEPEQRNNLTITNNYGVPVSLHFSFDTKANAADRDQKATAALSVTAPDITLAAGESLRQTIVLKQTDALAPGSQQSELVIAQSAISSTAVGVLPELRLPLILIKEDGAISSIGLTDIKKSFVRFGMPEHVTTTLTNTGNMIALPRGVVSVIAPNGTLVGKGTINVASSALSPNDTKQFTTRITPLAGSVLPGPYNIQVQYGLGGDQAAKTGTVNFFYVAWWHVATALVLIAFAFVTTHFWLPAYHYRRLKQTSPPGKGVMAKRHVA